MVTAEDAFRTNAKAVVRDYFVEPRIGALRLLVAFVWREGGGRG